LRVILVRFYGIWHANVGQERRKNGFCPTGPSIAPLFLSALGPPHQGDYEVRALSYWEQFLCRRFAQYSYRDSARDIELCLRSRPQALYHMRLRPPVARNILAKANKKRNGRIYADLAE
jgi:hypothetical protein